MWRKVVMTLVVLMMSIIVVGQTRLFDYNAVKVNVLSIPLRGVNVMYETSFGERTTMTLGINSRSMSKTPFSSRIESYYTDGDISLSNPRMSHFSITPEFKYFVLSSSDFQGFYVGAFYQYAQYDAQLGMNYIGGGNAGNPASFAFDGAVKTHSLGISFGHQWRLGNAFYIDWLIAGPLFGLNKGSAIGVNTNGRLLDRAEQYEVKRKLNEFYLPLVDVEFTTSASTIDMKTSGYWTGVRTALSLGYRF